jgi:hypothetical protein
MAVSQSGGLKEGQVFVHSGVVGTTNVNSNPYPFKPIISSPGPQP